MAEVVWSKQALDQLDEIAGYIALDNRPAASALVRKVFAETDLLARFPGLGRVMPALHRETYRMIWVAPCWIYYRTAADGRVMILHVRRAGRPLRLEDLAIE